MFASRKKLSIIVPALMSSALFTLASASINAQTDEAAENSSLHYSDVEEIVVRALPLSRTRLQSAQPVDVMVGETLADRRGMTLGETLQQQPGVQSSFYGAGSGRPIIRGLGGPRVRILEDGLATADTSTQSDDHAVTVDPMLIDQIEILRGPATLLYGSSASAGVVNIIDGRIPEQLAEEPLSGRFEIRGDNVADERSGVLRLDGGAGNIAWHLDGSWREADDYRIPGEARFADNHDDDHDEDHGDEEHHDDEHNDSNRLFNSFVESQSGTAGLSWIGERGFIGGSFRAYNSEYGIPAPHFHVEEEHDEEHEEEEHAEEEHSEEEEFAYIDMEQRSWDVKGGLDAPMRGISRATFRLGFNDYTHREIELAGLHEDDHADDEHADEEAHAHEEGTLFDVQTWQSRLSFETASFWGWEGAFGLQLEREQFEAEGAEAFVPNNETRSTGVFVLQERQWDAFTLSLGARAENTRVSLRDHGHEDDHEDHDHEDAHDDGHNAFAEVDSRTFRNVSASIGGIYEFNDTWQTSVNFSRVERAPSQTELFADGPHLATFSYEEGNAGLRTETAKAWDLTLHRHSDFFDFEISVFRKDVADFIYLATTDEVKLGFPVRETEQQDAEFTGMEVQGVWQLFTNDWGHFDLHVGYDRVNARLADNSYLPRISPERVSSGVDWHLGGWRGGLDVYRMMKQDKVPTLETATPGYTMVNLRVAYEFDVGSSTLEAFVQGRNLGNEDARVATSYLRDYAPLPGRNVIVGIRGRF
jgi:iron complex outermembrane receptor protein